MRLEKLGWHKKGGNYREMMQGISRRYPLSPVLGELYLKVLDDVLSQNKNCYYIHYMGDILIMAKKGEMVGKKPSSR